MEKALTIAAWIMCGLGFLSALAGKYGVPQAAMGVFFALAAILGGTSIVLSRSLELAGRFGGRVPITGRAAVLFGLGMIVAPLGGIGFALVHKYEPGPSGRGLGGLSILLIGVGLVMSGAGMWLKFAFEPWRDSQNEAMGQRVMMLVVRTWSFGWIAIIGAVVVIAGLVIAIQSLL